MEDKTKKLVVSLMGLLLITSAFGVIFYGLRQDTETYKYNDKLFIKTAAGWSVDLNGNKIIIESDPRELESIEVPDVSVADLNSAQKVYLAVNPNDNDLARSISIFNGYIKPFVNVLYITACTVEDEKCGNIPIRTCDDATNVVRVVLFRQDNETKLSYQDNCLLIQGKEPEISKYVDKLILKMLGL